MSIQKRNQETCFEQFQKDTADHEMQALVDNGVYRHLKFMTARNCAYWFQINTWPGYLAISGDMGEFMFSRTEDMFQFFRGGAPIDFRYWGEKCRAGTVRKFSKELLIESVLDWLEDAPKSEHDRAKERLSYVDSEAEAFEMLSDEFPAIDLCDFQETCYRDYDYHFLWCCCAIRWAIQKYDESKGGAA